jgi:TPR repeat protein
MLPSLVLALCLLGQEFTGPPAQVYQRTVDVLSGAAVGDHLNALDNLRRIARDGYMPAQYALASFYESGIFVPADTKETYNWYKLAGEQNDRLAEWALGRLYLNGTGVPSDRSEAIRWFRRASDQGDPFGAFWLATTLLQTNDPGSFAAFRRAAQLGSPQAQQKYAEMLASGQYGMPNQAEAYTWAVLSAGAGNNSARTLMSSIAAGLDSKAREAAEQRAADMAPSVRWDYVSRGCTGWDGEFSLAPSPPPARLQTQCRSAGAR